MIARGEREVTVGPTPMKRRVEFSEQNVLTESLSIDDAGAGEDETQLSGTVYEEAMVDTTSSLDVTVVHISLYWNDLMSAGIKQLTLIKNLESSFESNMEEVDDKVVQVAATVGVKPADNALPLTLWSAVAAVAEDYRPLNFTQLRVTLTWNPPDQP